MKKADRPFQKTREVRPYGPSPPRSGSPGEIIWTQQFNRRFGLEGWCVFLALIVHYIVLGCKGPGEAKDTNIFELSEKSLKKSWKIFWISHKIWNGTLGLQGGGWIISSKISNLGCLGLGKLIVTHIEGFLERDNKFKFLLNLKGDPRTLWRSSQLINIQFWLLGTRGVHWQCGDWLLRPPPPGTTVFDTEEKQLCPRVKQSSASLPGSWALLFPRQSCFSSVSKTVARRRREKKSNTILQPLTQKKRNFALV